jgi:hypothetical protein
MVDATTKTQRVLARVVVAIAVVLIVLGLAWYGISAQTNERIWHDIAARPRGPMTFRFVLQPAMAAIAAVHDGIRDARTGRTPYLWAFLTDAHHHIEHFDEGLYATARILLLGFGMDAIYQATVLKTFYPGEMVIVAVLLAFVPYVLLRGPVARIARWWMGRRTNRSAS